MPELVLLLLVVAVVVWLPPLILLDPGMGIALGVGMPVATLPPSTSYRLNVPLLLGVRNSDPSVSVPSSTSAVL